MSSSSRGISSIVARRVVHTRVAHLAEVECPSGTTLGVPLSSPGIPLQKLALLPRRASRRGPGRSRGPSSLRRRGGRFASRRALPALPAGPVLGPHGVVLGRVLKSPLGFLHEGSAIARCRSQTPRSHALFVTMRIRVLLLGCHKKNMQSISLSHLYGDETVG